MEGANLFFGQISQKNCMKMKKIRPEGGRSKFYCVDPPLVDIANYLLVSDVAFALAFAFMNKPKVNSCTLQDPVVVEESPA